jgi:glycosyltransferase involved in cell wall biosynthesis
MIRVFINAVNCVGGGGAATLGYLRALARRDPEGFRFTVAAPPGAGDLAPLNAYRAAGRHPLLRVLCARRALQQAGPIDIYHALTCDAPPAALRAAAVVATLTSANPYTPCPSLWTAWDQFRFACLRKKWQAALGRATHIVVHSQSARALLDRVPGAQGKPVFVRPLAVEAPAAAYNPEQRDGSCLLCPSSYLPHKNLARLLDAYDQAWFDGVRVPLVIAGDRPEPYGTWLIRHRDSLDAHRLIRLLPAQSPAALEALYARALAVVVPSFEETFCLPVAEAIARGLPVLCADPASVPAGFLPYAEFGPGLTFFDPFDVDSIAAALRDITLSEPRRAWLSAVLRANAVVRTWDDFAASMLGLYRELAAAPAPAEEQRVAYA